MRTRKISVLIYPFVVLLLAVAAAGQSRITSPKEQFGFNLGDDYQLANYAQLTDYWKRLAQQSDRFLQRETAKPIIYWEDSPQLGYEILPNKYFYRYRPPTPANDLLTEFWKLEKEAEKMLVAAQCF